jgi:UDP-N-acetylglucosamine:LPS N-acetylglucosamine transferase
VRIIVCGGRRYEDDVIVDAVLDRLHRKTPVTLLIHGGATGADALARSWAMHRGVLTDTYPAAWKTHGLAAGSIRNAWMLREGRPELVVAFPGGPGTADMLRQTRQAGCPVVVVERDGRVHGDGRAFFPSTQKAIR